MPEFVGSYDDLLDLLNEDGVAHQADKAELSVVIPTEKGELDSVMLLRWQDSDGVLQFIQQIPLEVKAAQFSELAEAITRLNHELAVPGVGMNYTDPLVYFRTYVPVSTGPVPATVIRALFSATVGTAANLMPVLRRVLDGSLAADGVLNAMNEQMAASASTAGAPEQAGHPGKE